MILLSGTTFTRGIFAGALVAVLASGAAVGAFASQDKLPGQTRHSLSQISATATTTPDAGETETAEPTKTSSSEGTPRAIKGIPSDNAQHRPADGDGICEKGETATKTTPSGVQVNVPCQALKDHGKSSGAPKADRTPEVDESPEADEPDANETPRAEDNNANSNDGQGQGSGHGHADKTPEPEETEDSD